MTPLARTLLATLLAVPTAAFAQGTTGDPPPKKDAPPVAPATQMSEKNQKMLDGYLAAWERRMAKIEGLETKIALTEIDQKGNKVVRTGDAAILKPNHAKMLLKLADDPTNTKKWMHFSADGKFLRQYDYTQKVVLTDPLPKDGVGDDSMMSFLFMTSAANLKKRYDLSIDVEDPKRHTENYVYLRVLPRSKADAQDFERAEVVLWKNNTDEKFFDRWMLPARIWYKQPNGEQIMWDFQNMTTQKKFTVKDFAAPGMPDGWTPKWMKAPPPSVIRTSAPGK